MKFYLIPFVLLLSACSSSNIVFYQSSRASLTVEGNPNDVSKPVQGNFGLKNRTFIYNPKRGDKKEVKSMISDAQFNIVDKSTPDMLTFKTALITGEAAADLDSSQAQQAAQMVSFGIQTSQERVANLIINKFCKNTANYVVLEGIIEKAYKDVNDADKAQIQTITGLGKDQYNERYHEAIKNQLNLTRGCPNE